MPSTASRALDMLYASAQLMLGTSTCGRQVTEPTKNDEWHSHFSKVMPLLICKRAAILLYGLLGDYDLVPTLGRPTPERVKCEEQLSALSLSTRALARIERRCRAL